MNAHDEIWGAVYRKKEEIVYRSIAGEALLVPVKGKLADMQRIYSLNPVGQFIWTQLDGEKRLGAIRNDILARFEVKEEQADADIGEFIAELLREGLISGGQ